MWEEAADAPWKQRQYPRNNCKFDLWEKRLWVIGS